MAKLKRVELASDMGESFGNYVLGRPEEIMKQINTAFLACGFHAGDPMVMQKTVDLCKKYNVIVGAHPGFPDLMGFGRRVMGITTEEATAYIIYQVGALKNFAEQVGLKVRTAKPHGAFYIWCIEREDRAKAVLDGLLTVGRDLEALTLPGLPWTPLHEAAKKAGLRVIPEIYPGLVYDSEGGVGVRRTYEAETEDEAGLIQKWIRTGKVATEAGTEIELPAESIEVHGDMLNAPEIVAAIKKVLDEEGVEIRAALD